jgi:transposase
VKTPVNQQNQQFLFEPVPVERLELQSKEDLITFIKLQQEVNESIIKENERLRALSRELKEQIVLINEEYVVFKSHFFGKSSEREPVNKEAGARTADGSANKKVKVQLPSLRYPDAPLIERDIELKELPQCECCGETMRDSGMTEDAEYLTVIPRQYLIVRQKRHKYCCGKCHGSVRTAPVPHRITPGSALSDELIIDVALSKYCDLIPIERYAAMAARQGLQELPPQSLIEGTHNLADFVEPAYEQVKEEILQPKVLHADETPHRMLEGDETSNWYLWGFSNAKASYFDIRNTRSGDVASELLKLSQCEFLVSDVFSGYAKAVRETNKARIEQNRSEIKNVYCNAHARRKFREARETFQEAQYFVDQYRAIYQLEAQIKEKPPDQALQLRSQMIPFFEAMRQKAAESTAGYPDKSSMGKAITYFLQNYRELTLFTTHIELPIDNNSQERLLRNSVIGRKTWYGTHSKRGARTAAILFSLVESCKLNKINPREYFQRLVADLHAGKPAYTPASLKIN